MPSSKSAVRCRYSPFHRPPLWSIHAQVQRTKGLGTQRMSSLISHIIKIMLIQVPLRLVLKVLFADLRFESPLAGRLLVLVLAVFFLCRERGCVLDVLDK
jgi:hypothetical protein